MKTTAIQKVLLFTFLVLFSSAMFYANSEIISLDEAYVTLMANPPGSGNLSLRKECFDHLDQKFRKSMWTDAEIKDFYNKMLKNVVHDFSLPSSAAAVVYKFYNHGFIIKLPEKVIAFDLTQGMGHWDKIPDEILKEIDMLFISHEHGDHYQSSLVKSVIEFGGTVFIPSEMSIDGAISLDSGEEYDTDGFHIIAHYGLHSVPVRVFEINTPLGLKIMHTGDNQTSETLPEGITDLDILLLNSWVNESSGETSNVVGMYNCLQKLKPKIMIPGHCNELLHIPEQRYAYDSVFKVMDLNIPSEVSVLAWGEKLVYQPNSILTISKTIEAPVIDGYWDAAWSYTPLVPFGHYLLKDPADWFDLGAGFRTMWDDENLYFFVTVKDDTLRTDNADAWNNDVIEIFFDGDNSKNSEAEGYDGNDIQMRFEYMKDAWNATGSEYQFVKTLYGYDFELRLPRSDLTFNLLEGKLLGFDIQVTDNDEGTQNHIVRWWSENINNYKDPSLFGNAKLSDHVLSSVMDVCYTPSPVTIDAEMDNAWIDKDLHILNNLIFGEELISNQYDAFAEWNSLWDENYLYFYLVVHDDKFISDSGDDEYFKDDSFELWIDGDNSKEEGHDGLNDFCLQYRYHPEQIIDAVNQSVGPPIALEKINHAAKIFYGTLTLELAIPLSEIGIEPYDDFVFGFDLDYNDDDDGGEPDSKFKLFAQYDAAWMTPADWGTLKLTGSGFSKESPVTINNFLKNTGLCIFPNPANDELNVILDELENDEITFTVFSLSGESLIVKDYPGKAQSYNLSLKELQGGMYFLQINTHGQTYFQKFCKLNRF